MSADSYLSQLRRWPPGRRATFRDPAKLEAAGKITRGTRGGLLLYPVPLPWFDAARADDGIPPLRYGQAVEVGKADGSFDCVVVEEADLELEPFDADLLRADLWHRVVNFDMPQILGLPAGARHEGLIDDVVFRGSPSGYAVGVRVEVEGNPSVNTHYLTVDFSQCRLRLRTR